MFLDLQIGKRSIRTNGAIIHQGAAGNDLSSASNRDIRVEKPAIRPQVTHSQFRNLTGAARGGILVTLTAGLRVIQRSQPIRHTFDLIELGLIGLMGGIIHHAVTLIIEAGGRFRSRKNRWNLFCRAPILSHRKCPGKQSQNQDTHHPDWFL